MASSVSRLVTDLESSGALHSEAVRRAFGRVRRRRFVTHWYRPATDGRSLSWSRESLDPHAPDAEGLQRVYSDRPLVTLVDGAGPVCSSTSPRLMAAMLEALDLRPGMRVLEVGTGTGYNAALIAEIVGDPGCVYTVDLCADALTEARAALRDEGYASVHVARRDGYWGLPESAPYDRIVVTSGSSDVSPHWLDQLRPEGRLLVPLQHGLLHPLVHVEHDARAGGAIGRGRIVGSSSFMPSRGALRWVNPWQSYLIGGLPAEPEWTRPTPRGLPMDPDVTDALDSPGHQDFHFFLSLSARELWYSGAGYGLADPGSGAAAVITGRDVQGFARPGAARALGLVTERLFALADAWQDCGRPRVSDYDLSFWSKDGEPTLEGSGRREWVVERLGTWEIVRLAR